LFAQWTVNPTYAVAYNGNGSTGGPCPRTPPVILLDKAS